MKKYSLLLLLLIFSSVASSTIYQTIGDSKLEYVILFDEYHGQYFNRTLMYTALSAFNNLLPDTLEDEIKIDLIFNNDSRFNSTNLQGVDLLIFTNPGFETENKLSYSEIEAILDYVELGGSLFLLGNPLTQDENITGHPSSINDLLAGRENKLSSARLRTGSDLSDSDLVVDDFSNTYGNESFVILDFYNATHSISEAVINPVVLAISEQETQINITTLYTSSISLGNEILQYSIGRTAITSYSVNENYDIFRDSINGFLTWLFAKGIGSSRMIVSGSSIMFSDLEISEDQKWIDQTDNLALWKNIILWLLKYTPHPARDPPPVWVFSYYALIIASLSIVIFSSAFIIYKYKQTRKMSIKIK